MWATVLLAAGVCVLLFLGSRPAEPSYAGHSLSYWLRKTYHPDPSISAQGEEAIRRIGTNAVPLLIQWLSERDPEWKWAYDGRVQSLFGHDWYRREPFLLGGRTWKAADALRIIGGPATNAIPALIASMKNHPWGGGSPSPHALALEQIGPESLPALTKALANPDDVMRWQAISALRLFEGTNIASILPDLIDAVHSSDPEFRAALTRLIAFPTGDARAIRTLIALIDDSSPKVREAAADSLASMGSEAEAALPLLTLLLQKNDTNLHKLVRFAITNINTNLVIVGNQMQQRITSNALK